jgi:hypothetical protein
MNPSLRSYCKASDPQHAAARFSFLDMLFVSFQRLVH